MEVDSFKMKHFNNCSKNYMSKNAFKNVFYVNFLVITLKIMFKVFIKLCRWTNISDAQQGNTLKIS